MGRAGHQVATHPDVRDHRRGLHDVCLLGATTRPRPSVANRRRSRRPSGAPVRFLSSFVASLSDVAEPVLHLPSGGKETILAGDAGLHGLHRPLPMVIPAPTTLIWTGCTSFFHGFLAGGGETRLQPHYDVLCSTGISSSNRAISRGNREGAAAADHGVRSPPNVQSGSGKNISRLRNRLDGILFGAAAGGRFAVMEDGRPICLAQPGGQTWEEAGRWTSQEVKHGGQIPTLDPHQAAGLIQDRDVVFFGPRTRASN